MRRASAISSQLTGGISPSKKSVWLDCDPGHDDAFAIILAGHSPSLRLIGVSTVAGNQSLPKVTLNARRVLKACGLLHTVPVFAGQHRPIVRQGQHDNIYDPSIHGDTGLDHKSNLLPPIDASDPPLFSAKAVVAMAQAIMTHPQPVDLVITGCCTNVAFMVSIFPEVIHNISSIVIMGGAIRDGNTPKAECPTDRSSVAEFNIARDPEAARLVFDLGEKGISVVLVPLDVTHTVLADEKILASIKRRIPSLFGDLCIDLLTFFQQSYEKTFGFKAPPLHDPTCLAYLINPDLFKTKKMRVDVECVSLLSLGQTVCDLHGTSPRPPNVFMALSIDVAGFWEILIASIERADAVSPVNYIKQ